MVVDTKIFKAKLQSYLDKFKVTINNNNCHFFDLETGGLDLYNSGILSASFSSVENGKIKNFYIKPKNQKVYSTCALKVNNLYIDELLKAKSIFDLIFYFDELSLGNNYIILIGHNIENFDIPLLMKTFQNAQKWDNIKPFIAVDTKQISKDLELKEKLNTDSLSQENLFKLFFELGLIKMEKEKYDNLLNDIHSSSTDILINKEILNVLLDFELGVIDIDKIKITSENKNSD